MTLKTKLLLILIPLVVIPIMLLGKLSYEHVVKISKKNVLTQMGVLLNQVEQHTLSHLETARANIQLLSESSRLTEYLLIEDEDIRNLAIHAVQGSMLNLFDNYTRVYKEYYEIRVLRAQGYEETRFSSENSQNITTDESQTPYFLHIQNSPNLIDVLFITNPDNQEPTFIVSNKLLLKKLKKNNPEAVLRGYLLITMRPTFLTEHKMGIIGKNSYLFITNKEGQVLYHPNPTLINTIPQLSALEFLKSHKNINESEPLLTVFNGNRVYMQGKQLHDNLYVFALLPEKEVFAGQPLKYLFIIATLTSIIVTLMFCFFSHLTT
jgi:hypothetical protein